MDANFFLQITLSALAAAGVGVGVYAGIKADLAVTRSKADNAHESASQAHRRIDDFYHKGN